MEYSPIQWNIHHNLPLLFIPSYPEDKLALGTLGVDDVVVHLLGLFHGILFVDDRVTQPDSMPATIAAPISAHSAGLV